MKEVYVARGVNDEVLYVGQGNVGRHTHCLCGTSHNQGLNRYFFSNGEYDSIKVEVLAYVQTQEEATELERYYIDLLKPKFNLIKYSERSAVPKTTYVGFAQLAKDFYETGGLCEKVKSEIEKHGHTELFDYVEAFGIECLKTHSYSRAKLKQRYQDRVVDKDIVTREDMINIGGFEFGVWYSLKEVKERVQVVYDKLGLTRNAKASDASKYLTVKRKRHLQQEGCVVY